MDPGTGVADKVSKRSYGIDGSSLGSTETHLPTLLMTSKNPGKGYTSKRLGLFSRLNEIASLIAGYRQGPEHRVRRAITEVNAAMAEIATLLGKPVKDLHILEIGSGQLPMQLAILGTRNHAIGIDQESADDSLSVRGVLKTIKTDGPMRAVKTMARKAMGIDRQSRNEYVRQTGLEAWPPLRHLKMDAEQMSFQDDSFDVVFSRAVFEHIANPEGVLRQVARVLRPGGVFYCIFHLYTSDSGCHDVRILLNRRGDLPLWPHLRESHRHKVIENTYLNRLSLQSWRSIFQNALPGARVDAMMDDTGADRKAALAKIRENGELSDYSDEELMTVTVRATWKKSDPSEASKAKPGPRQPSEEFERE